MSDLIHKDDLVRDLQELLDRETAAFNTSALLAEEKRLTIEECIVVTEAQPVVSDSETLTASWKPVKDGSGGYWECSHCKTPTEAHGANIIYAYCPFCGARMTGVKTIQEAVT